MTRKEMSNSSDTAHAVLAYAGTRGRPDDPVRVWGGHASGPDVTYHYAANQRGVFGTQDAFANCGTKGEADFGIAPHFLGFLDPKSHVIWASQRGCDFIEAIYNQERADFDIAPI